MMPFKKSVFAGHPRLRTDMICWQADREDIDHVTVVPFGPLPEGYTESARATMLETESGISSLIMQIERDGVERAWAAGIIADWYLLGQLAKGLSETERQTAVGYILALGREGLPPLQLPDGIT